MLARLSVPYVLFASIVVAVPTASAPAVKLDDATLTGKTSGNIQQFLGIPFAQPPVGNQRFRLPQSIPAYNESFSATSYGPACPQQTIKFPNIRGLPGVIVDNLVDKVYSDITPESEDCLTINVVTPTSASPTSKLPVVVWIYGGGFEIGGTNTYDGSGIVQRSISMNQPIVFVSMNYRVTGFGFLASKEVKAAGVGNLGLQDQREAFRWVQKYITAFGGDPTKVTIWGESAGAISVSLHMIANNGNTEGLFRGAIMESGAPLPVGDLESGQIYYDAIVKDTGCTGSSDTLQCLREAPFQQLKAAIDNTPSLFSYQGLRLEWAPKADGVFLTDTPQRLVQNGKVAKVPYITGNCDDEGTIFSFNSLNVTTEAQFKDYVKNIIFLGISDDQVDTLAKLYPADVTQGSPFDTGLLNAVTPQFKRIAALVGDGILQAPRRSLLTNTSGKQNIWVFLSKRFKTLPSVGSMHASDLIDAFFQGGALQDYIIHFTNELDPNGLSAFRWPQYTTNNPNQLIFSDSLPQQSVEKDTYRQSQMDFLTHLSLNVPS